MSNKTFEVKRDGGGDPYTCPKCGSDAERKEDIDGIEFTFSYDAHKKDWEQVSENSYGSTVVTFHCTNQSCGFNFYKDLREATKYDDDDEDDGTECCDDEGDHEPEDDPRDQ